MAKTSFVSNPIAKHPIILGGLVKTVADTATGTLYVAFVLDLGLQMLHFQSVAASIIGMLLFAFVKSERGNTFSKKHFGAPLKKLAFKHFKAFMFFEGLMNLIVAVASLVTGNAWFALITCLLLLPYEKIQQYGVNELKAHSFTLEDRALADEFHTDYDSIISLVSLGIGFILNWTCTGAIAYAIMCAADTINNFFYLKAYNDIQLAESVDEPEEEDEEEAEPVSAS